MVTNMSEKRSHDHRNAMASGQFEFILKTEFIPSDVNVILPYMKSLSCHVMNITLVCVSNHSLPSLGITAQGKIHEIVYR